MTGQRLSEKDFDEISITEAPSLDLPALTIERFLRHKKGIKYMVFYTSVSSEEKENVLCPYCKVPTKIILNGRSDPRLVHDVIRNNHRVDIILFSQRYKCKACEQRLSLQRRRKTNNDLILI